MKELQEESSDVEKEPITRGIIYTRYKYVYLSILIYVLYSDY